MLPAVTMMTATRATTQAKPRFGRPGPGACPPAAAGLPLRMRTDRYKPLRFRRAWPDGEQANGDTRPHVHAHPGTSGEAENLDGSCPLTSRNQEVGISAEAATQIHPITMVDEMIDRS